MSRPLSITIVLGPFFPTPPEATGAVQRIWFDLAQRFVAAGHRVTLLACHRPGQPRREEHGNLVIRRATAFRQSPRVYYDILKDFFYSARMIMMAPRADIMVTNSFWGPVLALPRRRRTGRIFVSIARFPKGQVKLYKRAECLHSVSSAVADAIIEEDASAAGRTVVVPNPIATKVFLPPAAPRSYSGERILAYTGRLHPEKGVHLLVEAFARLAAANPGLRLRIIGPTDIREGGGGEDYIRKIKSLAGPLPVELVPAINDRPALAAALQAVHYYCYPSLAEKGESFGVAPLEAMGTALPTIVSNLRCFHDFVRDGHNGLIFDHRAADPVATLTAALDRVIRDEALARRLGDAAAATAQDYSNERVAELFINEFQKMMDRPR